MCHFCTVSSVELQPLGEEGLFSCGICRALDRICGVCWRLPRDCDQHRLAVLRETEGRLRDWIGFNAPPPYEVPGYRPESRGGVVSSLLPAKPKPAPKPSAKACLERPSASSRPEGRSRSPPSAVEEPARKKRHKQNRGSRRTEWQDVRWRVGHPRANPSIEEEEFREDDDNQLE